MAPLPRVAQKAGTTIDWPEVAVTPDNATELLTRVRLSELRNARGANACKARYNQTLKLYGKR